MNQTTKSNARSYGFSELALSYSPALTGSSASKQLLRWIIRHPTLSIRLRNEGWQKGIRRLTPKQVECIFDCLGEP